MRTFVYIDGFNLYYNLFKGQNNVHNKALKWLNLKSLIEDVLKSKYKKNIILSVKYYTAHVKGAIDNTKPIRQNAYLRALELYLTDFEIVYGKFIIPKAYRPTVSDGELIEVYLPEEKGSDVNLSVHLVYEALKDMYDVAIVVTNDTDMREAFRIVSDELKKNIILIQPDNVKTASSLKRYSSDVLKFGSKDLKNHQLPDRIGPKIRKPEKWA